jgi:ubiquinone/menaquinone biosynthesis C-methylase UbiE
MWTAAWYRDFGRHGLQRASLAKHLPLRTLVQRSRSRTTGTQRLVRRLSDLRLASVPNPSYRQAQSTTRIERYRLSPLQAVRCGVSLVKYATGTALRSAFFLLFRFAMLQLVASGSQWSSNLNTQQVVFFSRDWRAQLEFVNFFFGELSLLASKEWRHIQAGTYIMPAVPTRHSLDLVPRLVDFIQNLGDSMKLREAGIVDAVPEAFRLNSFYPEYYKQNFHYQTDGYLSAESAARYDFQVEVLFGGLADMMRRQALVPLLGFLRAEVSKRTPSSNGHPTLSVLNVPCGPGGFLLDLMDNLAADERLRNVKVTSLDLSPFYLQRAQTRVQALPESTPRRNAAFVHANAESLPFPDASFDAIVSIYLFHELPMSARERAIAEWTRVLRPGGRIVFADSIQTGDNPRMEAAMNRFRVNYHEPYYLEYIETNLPQLFKQASGGQLSNREQDISFLTKVCVFEKQGGI